MSIINRPSYVDLVQREVIDIAISPRQATIGSLLTHVRRGDVVMVHSLRKGAAEAIDEVTPAQLPGLLHGPEHRVDRAQAPGHGLEGHHVPRHHAVAFEEQQGAGVSAGRGLGRVVE